MGATICADLALCPAALGDIGNLLLKRYCMASYWNLKNMNADVKSMRVESKGAEQDRYAIGVSSIKE